MSKAAKACPECLSSNLQDENINGHTTLICTECGVVVDDHDITEENYDSMPFFVNNANITALARNRKVGCLDSKISRKKLQWGEVVKTFCKLFKFNIQMERQAVNYIHKAFHLKEFYARHSEQKHALCAACIYLTCRTYNWPVTMDQVVYFCSISRECLAAAFKQLVRALDITLEFVKVEDFIPTCLQENGLGKLKLEEQVTKIICLSEEAWIATGRNRILLIIAAAFIAWKSNPENFKYKTKRKHFSRIISVKSVQWTKRVKEIEDVLFKLACTIPWKTHDNVNRKCVGLYVDDIMKYRLSLFSQFKINDDDDENDDDDIVLRIEDDPKTVSESPELTDRDLPDDEMHIYLKSEQEIASEKLHFDRNFEELSPKKKIEKRTLLKRKHNCIEDV